LVRQHRGGQAGGLTMSMILQATLWMQPYIREGDF
jgi:hypothetical protein